MERLKLAAVIVVISAKINLHSSMERLKRKQLDELSSKIYNLHSSMERLKPPLDSFVVIVAVLFTFQYGKIKTLDF